MKEMKQVLVFTLAASCAIVVGGATAEPASTTPPPDSASWVKADVNEGDTFSIDCVRRFQGTGSVFIAYSITGANGERRHGHWSLASTEDDVVVSYSVEGESGSHTITQVSESNLERPYHSIGASEDDGDVLRVVWAGWDASTQCIVTLEGIELPAFDLDVESARQVETLEHGVGVGATIRSAAVAGTMKFEAHGFLFALLPADGKTTIRGPEGQVSETVGRWNVVAESTSGSWSFVIEAGAVAGARGWLWAATLPV